MINEEASQKKYRKKLKWLIVGIVGILSFTIDWGQKIEWVLGLFEKEPRIIEGPDQKFRGYILKDIPYEPDKPAGVLIGTTLLSFGSPINQREACISIGDGDLTKVLSKCNISFKEKDGEIVFDIEAYNLEGEFIAEIKENYIVGYTNKTFDRNYDKHGFELIDGYNNVLMSILYLGENTFSFQGVIYDNTGTAHLIKDNKRPVAQGDIKRIRWLQSSLKKHFVYNEPGYVGKRSEYGYAKLAQERDTASFVKITER